MWGGDAPQPKEQLPKSSKAPGTPSNQTRGLGRDRLNLNSLQGHLGGAANSRCEATESGRGGPLRKGRGRATAQVQGAGRYTGHRLPLPAASSIGSSRNSRGRSNSCQIRQLEEGEAELESL